MLMGIGETTLLMFIVGTITGMAFDNKNGLKRAKMFANKATDEGGNKIIIAIDKLSATYNTVKPKNKDK